jgi:hypothetical protein
MLYEIDYSCHVTYTHSLRAYGRLILMGFVPGDASVRLSLARKVPPDCAFIATRLIVSTVRMTSLIDCEVSFLRSFSVRGSSL